MKSRNEGHAAVHPTSNETREESLQQTCQDHDLTAALAASCAPPIVFPPEPVLKQRLLDGAVGMSEEDRDYLSSLQLSVNQLKGVLEFLDGFYFNSSLKNCRNLRVAVRSRRKLVSAYKEKASLSWDEGVLSRDAKFHVSEPDWRKEIVMVGFDHD